MKLVNVIMLRSVDPARAQRLFGSAFSLFSKLYSSKIVTFQNFKIIFK